MGDQISIATDELEAGQLISLAAVISNYLLANRIQEAVAFNVTIGNGPTFEIVSDNDPRLKQEVNPEQVSIKVKQSSSAGSLS